MKVELCVSRIQNSNRYQHVMLVCQYCGAQGSIYEGRGVTRSQAKHDAYETKCSRCHESTAAREERKRRNSA
ncbi:MAG: hypothetical protein WC047_00100 [Kiritimatiellales bacterium]